MAKNASVYIPLETINEDGSVPASRLSDARAVHEVVQKFIEANDLRSQVDGNVYGLISGNPPYSNTILRREGEAWRSNFATRVGEAAFNLAKAQFEDIILKSPILAEVVTNFGDDVQKQYEWGTIISEEFEWLNQQDALLVYNLFLSIHDMTLYRCGPIMWEDDYDFRFKAIPQRYVLVDNESASAVQEWKISVVRCKYSADQLYSWIINPESATLAGVDVSAVRWALTHAAPSGIWPRNRNHDWEWFEQRLRNNDLYWGAMCESIPVAHVFFREFPKGNDLEGRITKCSVLEDHAEQPFLFRKIGMAKRWEHIINPMYYDRGDGTHHSVKGYGIKGFGQWSVYDRLQNHLVDAAFMAGSMHFQAATANDLENLSVTNMGPYMWHPPGGTYLQTQQLGAALEGPFSIKQDLLKTVTDNLGQYRPVPKEGNPVTKGQYEMDAANQEQVGESQLTRFFEQLDDLWAERYRRASNPNLTLANPGGKLALEFQKRCKMRGVPAKALVKTESVKAVRSVGYGSPSARMQANNRLLQRYQLYDESGKRQILEELTAADVGYRNVRKYMPKKEPSQEAEQKAEATDKVAGMKVGVRPLVAPSQNPVIYATIYLKAADEAAGTLAKTNGATIRDVYSFLGVAGPAIAEQLDRFKEDPTRKQQHEALEGHWKQLAKLHDDLGKQLRKQVQQQAEQQRNRQQQMSEQQQKINGELALKLRESETKLDIMRRTKGQGMALKQQQHDQKLRTSAEMARQKMALSDATTAANIIRQKQSAMKE